MRFCLTGVFAAVLVLLLGACTNDTEPPRDEPSTSAAASTAANPSEASQAEIDAVKDAAFNYYYSEERTRILQEVLDTEGMRLARDLLAQRIPSGVRGAQKLTPAPRSGFGMLHSLPNDVSHPDVPYVEIMVRFVSGKVDLNSGALSLFIIKNNVRYDLIGEYLLDSAGELLPGTTANYTWNVTSSNGFSIAYRDSTDTLALGTPLDPKIRYQVNYYDPNVTGSTLVTTELIKQKDGEFIAALKGLNLNGSDWK